MPAQTRPSQKTYAPSDWLPLINRPMPTVPTPAEPAQDRRHETAGTAEGGKRTDVFLAPHPFRHFGLDPQNPGLARFPLRRSLAHRRHRFRQQPGHQVRRGAFRMLHRQAAVQGLLRGPADGSGAPGRLASRSCDCGEIAPRTIDPKVWGWKRRKNWTIFAPACELDITNLFLLGWGRSKERAIGGMKIGTSVVLDGPAV